MSRLRTATMLIAITSLFLGAASAEAKLPKNFFGIVPQTSLTTTDTSRMKKGGIESVRIGLAWSQIQPTETGGFNWSVIDQVVTVNSQSRLESFPFLYETPSWVASKTTALPVATARQRNAWVAFLQAAVQRYGPAGAFWQENPSVPKVPIRRWQVWNEENFFYFTSPISPPSYAKLVKISAPALRGEDPGADVILGGLFGNPKGPPSKARAAISFLDALYKVPGIKSSFDGVALHPYAANAAELKRLTEAVRKEMVQSGDRSAELHLTEIGWGSQAKSPVSFEKGPKGQVRELNAAYKYLIAEQRRLNLKSVFWFSWKDTKVTCSFCDSVGLFGAGAGLKAKPSWSAFVKFTGGSVR